jgi:hypothetical protein
MHETLKTLIPERLHPSQFVGPLHHLQPEKPGMVMKCPH